MQRPARIGYPLPGAHRAQASPEKWTGWILSERGHGPEWVRVFRAGPQDSHLIWAGIVRAVQRAPVVALRDRGRHGVVCGVAVRITVNARTAVVMTAWHYRDVASMPRLVTTYPIS